MIKKHITKEKGDLGVLKVKTDLCEKGYLILSPESEHSPFDLVVYKDFQFKKVQVKYRTVVNNCLHVAFKSSWTDKNGNHFVPMDKTEVDVIAVYCPDTNKCYYFNPSNFNKAILLRISPTKNNQSKNVKFADDYLNMI